MTWQPSKMEMTTPVEEPPLRLLDLPDELLLRVAELTTEWHDRAALCLALPTARVSM